MAGSWPPGTMEMAARIAAFDWTRTPLGPTGDWPASLRSAVELMLPVGFPMIVLWGPDLIQIYNEGYRVILADKHPRGLGQPTRECWPEVWEINAPLYERVWRGETVTFEDALYPLARNGPVEDAWFTLSYSPLRHGDAIGGVLVTLFEETGRHLAARRLLESEARFGALSSASAYAVFRMNADWSQMEALAGKGFVADQTQPTDAWLERYIPPEDQALVLGAVEAALAGRVIFDLEHRVRLAAGGVGWAHARAVPLFDGRGAPVEWIGSAIDITARKAAEAEAREREEQQRLLLRLSDAIRPLEDTGAAREAASRILGEGIGADRVYYVEYDAEGGLGIVADDYLVPGLPSLAGRYPYEAFRTTYEQVGRGATWTVRDVRNAADIDVTERAFYADQGVLAWVDVPLIKAGRLRSVLCVVQTTARNWTPGEVALIENVAERTWAAIERGEAQAALLQSEQRLRMALEAGRMGTWRYDLATGDQQWSQQQFQLFGLQPGATPPSRDLFLSLVHPEDHGLIEFGPEDLAPGRGLLDAEFRVVLPSGETRWLVSHTVVRRDAQDNPVEMIGLNWDITERRRAELALRESEERLRQFGEASQDVLWIRDATSRRWVYLTPAFEIIYGMSRDAAQGADDYHTWLDLVLEADREGVAAHIERVRRGERAAYDYRIRRPADGEVRWLRDTVFPIRGEDGKVTLIGGIGHDITARKQAEAHQRLLLSELQHRVRNTLAVIRSIIRRTAATTATKDDFFMHLEGRIDALARVQAVVTRDPSRTLDLGALLAEELRVVGAQEGHGLSLTGPAVGFANKTAETLTLAIHELATNAVKYGALSVDGGSIDVDWLVLPAPRRLRLVWQEHGVPHIAGFPPKRGFGIEILERTLGYELKAETELSFPSDGLRCVITLPLDLPGL